MKTLISILILLAVGFGGWKVWEYYQRSSQEGVLSEQDAGGADVRPEQLSGLPYQLEQKLRDAKAAGPETFRKFIEGLKQFPEVKDPRLAWIELDYVVMVGVTNPIEARKIFAAVKKRTPADSPVYPRVRALEKTYG